MKIKKAVLFIIIAFAILLSNTSCNLIEGIPNSTAIPTTQTVDFERKLTVNDLDRSYLLHIPSDLDRQQPVPVVFAFHGYTLSPTDMKIKTGFDSIADQAGFTVVYPMGVGLSWNTTEAGPGDAIAQNVDESAFVKGMLSDLEKIITIDPSQIYAVGYSQGGALVYKLACEMADTFAAIASVSGPMEYSTCDPSQPVSVIHIHGLADRTVPFTGGGPFGLSPVENGISTWVEMNQCSDITQEGEDHNGITYTAFASCQSSSAVELYTIDGLDHSWPSEDETSTSEIWEFLASHPKP